MEYLEPARTLPLARGAFSDEVELLEIRDADIASGFGASIIGMYHDEQGRTVDPEYNKAVAPKPGPYYGVGGKVLVP